MNDMAPQIGHNAPPPPEPLTPDEIERWIPYAYASLFTRADEVIAALEQTAAAVPQIVDDEQRAQVGENRRIAETHQRTTEDRRTEAKRPFLLGGKAVDRVFFALSLRVKAALHPIIERCDVYDAKKLATERRERELKAAEAAQLAREAEAVAFKRAQTAGEQVAALERAATLAAEAQAAEDAANASAADMTRVRSDYGGVSSSSEVAEITIVDAALVPREYCEPSMSLIRARIKRMTATPAQARALREILATGAQPIPGVRVEIVVKSRQR